MFYDCGHKYSQRWRTGFPLKWLLEGWIVPVILIGGSKSHGHVFKALNSLPIASLSHRTETVRWARPPGWQKPGRQRSGKECALTLCCLVIAASGMECLTRAEADIVLLVDGSWSIGRANFRTVRSFISRIVEVFEIGPKRVQIGRSDNTDRI